MLCYSVRLLLSSITTSLFVLNSPLFLCNCAFRNCGTHSFVIGLNSLCITLKLGNKNFTRSRNTKFYLCTVFIYSSMRSEMLKWAICPFAAHVIESAPISLVILLRTSLFALMHFSNAFLTSTLWHVVFVNVFLA